MFNFVWGICEVLGAALVVAVLIGFALGCGAVLLWQNVLSHITIGWS